MGAVVFRVVLAGLAIILSASWALADQVDQKYIRQAIELSRQAMEAGNHPFGAVLVKDGKVLATALNTVRTDHNVTHHAETNLVAAACRKLGVEAVKGSTLYASSEPCAMCCGAMYIFGVKRLVYGLSDKRLGAIVGWEKPFPAREFFHLAKDPIQVTGPMLEDQAAEIFKEFMARMRKQAPPRAK